MLPLSHVQITQTIYNTKVGASMHVYFALFDGIIHDVPLMLLLLGLHACRPLWLARCQAQPRARFIPGFDISRIKS
jgi:hypothetical protein